MYRARAGLVRVFIFKSHLEIIVRSISIPSTVSKCRNTKLVSKISHVSGIFARFRTTSTVWTKVSSPALSEYKNGYNLGTRSSRAHVYVNFFFHCLYVLNLPLKRVPYITNTLCKVFVQSMTLAPHYRSRKMTITW